MNIRINFQSLLYSRLLQRVTRMSSKKIVDTFNEIDSELVYIKNKLSSLSELVGDGSHGDSASAVSKLSEENRLLMKETEDLLKQISYYDLLDGQPPLALKVFAQSQVRNYSSFTIFTSRNLT